MSRRLLPAAIVACAGLALAAPAAPATPTSGATAIVTLGDSFISGEAGRWKGNSVVSTTDRAARTGRGPARATTPAASTARRTPTAATARTWPRS